jgi:cation transport ATPase
MFLVQGHFVLSTLPVFWFALNRKLLATVKDESRHDFIDAFAQQPRQVWVVVNGVEVEKPFETLQAGDVVSVGAGETIPVDGIITQGLATIDQQLLTGESQPVEKGGGEPVCAVTVVLSGHLSVRVEQAGQATAAAHIVSVLNQTVEYKTQLQLWAETMAERTVTPTLLLAGVGLPLLGSDDPVSRSHHLVSVSYTLFLSWGPQWAGGRKEAQPLRQRLAFPSLLCFFLFKCRSKQRPSREV